MPDFIVQVDDTDFLEFSEALSAFKISFAEAQPVHGEIEATFGDGRRRPVGARYFVVLAQSSEDIYEAIEETARRVGPKWHEGAPHVVIKEAPPNSGYPAKDFSRATEQEPG